MAKDIVPSKDSEFTDITELGFSSLEELQSLVSKVDLSTKTKLSAFLKWQKDGTKQGLLKLLPSKPKLCISFSGGETSAMMTHYLLNKYCESHEVVVVFANTGLENEQTLEFVRDCDRFMNFNTVWIEAVISLTSGVGTSFKVVNFESASRDGEPFESAIAKYGIPNMAFPHCTRTLKGEAIRAYLRSIGWCKGKYSTAIGIRADEWDRKSKNAERDKLVYPLIDEIPTQKPDVNNFWSQQPFRLQLKGYEGNCKTCWKKTDYKLCTIAVENPRKFDFFLRMEEKYQNYRPEGQPNRPLPARFFRKNRTVANIFDLASKPFPLAQDDSVNTTVFEQTELNLDLGCTESCEAF